MCHFQVAKRDRALLPPDVTICHCRKLLPSVVKVNGVVVPPGPNTWTFDAASNSIKFNSTATPQPGVPLEIEYTQSCF